MISGSIVALVTPMKANGDIDWQALDKLVALHKKAGTNAIVAVGTTGESATLSVEEHTAVIEAVVKAADKEISVIAGTGANSTTEAIELTENAKNVGADSCLLVTPYYNRPTQEGLYQHFKAIAEAVDIPQILYNVPARTACDMSNETVLRLSEIKNITGIKDATGDLERGGELIKLVPEDFAVYSGDDPTAIDLILAGGRGNISVTANVVPDVMSAACASALAGDAESAHKLDEKMRDLHGKLFVESSPAPTKWALEQMGYIESGIRLPLVYLSEQNQPVVRNALTNAGILDN